MFHSARLKLTAWYLVIIMLISMTFSVVIYRVLISEVERFEHVQRLRLERRLQNSDLFAPFNGLNIVPAPLLQVNFELVEEVKQRVLFILILVNCGILILSGAFGYLLAGRTLTPIKEMIDEQNRFISDASHELRTPLTSLKSALEVYLRDRSQTLSEAKTLARESIIEVNKLQSLSESLLQLARSENSGIPPKFELISLTHCVKEAIHKVLPLSKKKKISVKEKLEDIHIYANEHSLIDVLVILLDNAVKYSSIGRNVLIKTEKKDVIAQINITDEGIGISKKDLPHVFERFYRADSARSKGVSNGGYGLGLAIAKKIIATYKGSIYVESEVDKGSTFTVCLPL